MTSGSWPGHDVLRRRRGGAQEIIALEHLADMERGGEDPPGLHVLVVVRDVGSDDHPAAFRVHAHELQSRRMAWCGVQLDSREWIVAPVVQRYALGVVQPHDADHVIDLEGVGELVEAHVPSDRVVQLRLLQMEMRAREAVEVADMVVVQMGQDHRLDRRRASRRTGTAHRPDSAGTGACASARQAR